MVWQEVYLADDSLSSQPRPRTQRPHARASLRSRQWIEPERRERCYEAKRYADRRSPGDLEVSDFQCPFCRQWHEETYQKLRDEFVKTGKVRLAYVNFPLAQHTYALPAAEAAMCAGVQGKFWEMHDALFTNQAKWETLPAPAAFFESLARGAGVDVARWRQCVQSRKMTPLIMADQDRARVAGAASTPSFMIGDKLLVGTQPIENLRSAIESALAKSKKPTP